MDYLDRLHHRLADSAAIGADERRDVVRALRLSPLAVLARRRSALVALLLVVPELHDRLRATWSREDAVLTAQIFRWVEQARLHRDRTTGPVEAPLSWMALGDLSAAA